MPPSARRILYDDGDFLAVDKLAGELVVAGKGKMQKLPLLDFLRKDYPGLHPLSRLDLETTGVVVFARNRITLHQVLDAKFANWTKTYRTLVYGVPSKATGTITFHLPARASKEKLPAETRYRVLERFPGCSLVEAEILTGRHHQIRRHFQMIGHPLLLDDVYGNAKANRQFGKAMRLHKFFLHAASVTFPHPVSGKIIHIEAPMPRVFEEVLKKLRR